LFAVELVVLLDEADVPMAEGLGEAARVDVLVEVAG